MLVSGTIATGIHKFKRLDISAKAKHATMTVTYGTLSIIIAWFLIESAFIFPNYLAYFNQLAGGADNGYKYVVDSNLDWGQDYKRFADWVKENDIQKIDVDYFGWTSPYSYLPTQHNWITADTYSGLSDFKERNQTGGLIAVSAQHLQTAGGGDPDKNNYNWLKQFEPVHKIGYSIFIYQID